MTHTAAPMVRVEEVAKSFTLHLQSGVMLEALSGVSFEAAPGECVVLSGPSGVGKSSLLRMIYGNYAVTSGKVSVRDGSAVVDITTAAPRRVLDLRRRVMGYVSQFLRVIPRVSTREIVARSAREGEGGVLNPLERADELLGRLNLPERLWGLPPATFSGGEQQRVNIARGFASVKPLLLLDEPTASLDAANRQVVVELIRERKREGTAIVGIFHDEDVRDQVADRIVEIGRNGMRKR